MNPDDVTIFIPTSPISVHPSTSTMEETINSVRYHFPTSQIVIIVDGVRSEQIDYTERYDQYVDELVKYVFEDDNTSFCFNDGFLHQAASMLKIFDNAKYSATRLLIFVEHDTPLVTDYPIDWDWISKIILEDKADLVRLNHESYILDEHREYVLDGGLHYNGPFVKTIQWSQRPHMASWEFYKRVMNDVFTHNSRSMIEDGVHAAIARDIWTLGRLKSWDKYRLLMYAPDGNMKRSYHLDGRQSDPKYDMVI